MFKNKITKFVLPLSAAISIVSMTASSTVLAADSYPSNPINYIIPFNAGGESDLSARFQQAMFKKHAGVQAVIQYMPGAGGAVAWSQLNSIEGDGYTVMGINIPHTIIQPMVKKSGYKTEELTPIYYFHYTPNAIFVPANSQFKKLEELISYAKANPGLVTFAGSGSNSANHIGQATFDKLMGVKTTYIPFSGIGPAMTALMGSQVTAGFNYATSGTSAGDKLRMLAVSSEKRLPAFPDVPTFKELGVDLVGGAYRGVAVPKSTPEDIRIKLSKIISDINHDPVFIKQMEDNGFVLTDIDYQHMDEFIHANQLEYQGVAKLLGLIK
jgi:tripartite-type tricarboxylate transporter receptor subunit TctC